MPTQNYEYNGSLGQPTVLNKNFETNYPHYTQQFSLNRKLNLKSIVRS